LHRDYETSWEPEVAEEIRKNAVDSPKPFMVALVGIPGSGKSTSALILAKQHEDAGVKCMVMSHDGYHYPLLTLKLFPDAKDAVYRHGAPDTFDPAALLRDLHRIKSGDEELITIPAFDHENGDPEPDRHVFDRNQHDVVICEGLYLLHNRYGWEGVCKFFDLTIFLNSDVDVCIERVKIRNRCIPGTPMTEEGDLMSNRPTLIFLYSSLGYTPEEIDTRCEKVDRVNAMTVMQSKNRADIVVDSLAARPPVNVSVQHSREFSEELTMQRTLTALSLRDIDLVDIEENDTTLADWALNISSRRPRDDPAWSQSNVSL
jgi:pantothenate kinase